jgi:GTPase SAR1 family protein
MLIESTTFLSFGKWLSSKIAEKGFEQVYKQIVSDNGSELNKKFYIAVSNVSNLLQKRYPEALGNSIEYFFKKNEIFNELIKLLFRNSKINPENIAQYFDSKTLPDNFIQEFIVELRSELLKDQEFDKIFSDNELFITVLNLGQDVSIILNNSNITSGEVSRISKMMEEKIGRSFNFTDFIELYSKNALNNLSQINFIGLGIDISIKKNRKKLSDVFVLPNFMPLKPHSTASIGDLLDDDDSPNVISYNQILESCDKVVILGDPGSGKSILIKSLICDILLKNGKVPTKFEDHIPFRIELRKYLAFKKGYRGNILGYLRASLEVEYQIPNLTEFIIHDILSGNKCIILFDGLDEIFDISDKISTKNDIENFDNGYPRLKLLVTSRTIGYEEARFDAEKFKEFSILHFNDQQVQEYVKKWYAKEEENKEIRQREVEGFISKKDEIDQELIKNPLLLSLIVIIYRNILKLPESKLEIYQSCTKTLVDKWDASKDLIIALDPLIIKSKEKLFADLAYWQYENLSGKSFAITYEKAKGTIARSIQDKLKISDETTAEELAENFMEYAQKRSIYFENNFTHKTFLEYYTAYWIYSNIEKKHNIEERDKILSTYIGNSFWHIVLELLLNLIDKDQGDTEVIDSIISNQITLSIISLPFLLSVLPNLKNIDASIARNMIQISLSWLLTNYSSTSSDDNVEKIDHKIFPALKKLYSTSSFKNIITEILNEHEALLQTLEKAVAFYVLIHEFANFGPDSDTYAIKNQNLYNQAEESNPYLFTLTLHRKEKDFMSNVNRFLNLFGVKELFSTREAYFDSYHMGALFSYFLYYQFQPENIGNLKLNIDLLKNNGVAESDIIRYADQEHGTYFNSKSSIKQLILTLDSLDDIFLCKLTLTVLSKRYNTFKIENKFLEKHKKSQKIQAAKKILEARSPKECFDIIDNLFHNSSETHHEYKQID